jgi:Beta-galactosidase
MRLFKPLCTVRTYLWVIAFGVSGQFSLFAAAGLPLRTGLWAMQPIESGRNVSAFGAKVRANSYLSGVCLHIGWKDIEKEPGQLDFSAIDKYVAALRRIGMKYELGIKPGVDTPAFLYQQGAQSFETQVQNPHRPNFGAAVTIPVPWDPKYQQSFSRLVTQLGERYGSDPLCVSVVLTCANFMSKEMLLPKTPADLAKWKQMGDYGAKLLDVYKKYTDEWAKAFPRQQISLHLTKVLDLPPTFAERVVEYGLSKYPERFTIQNCALTGRKEDTGKESYDIVQKYRDRAHHGFQSVAGFAHSGDRMGSMEMAALNVVHADGEYWELWQGDGMNPQICGAIDKAWREAKQLGYDGYKKKLIGNGSYRQQSYDTYTPRGGRHRGRGRRNAGLTSYGEGVRP